LKVLGVKIVTSTTARLGQDTGTAAERAELVLTSQDGGTERLEVSRVLVTVGRRPRVDAIGIAELGLDRAEPFIAIDEHCRTSMRRRVTAEVVRRARSGVGARLRRAGRGAGLGGGARGSRTGPGAAAAGRSCARAAAVGARRAQGAGGRFCVPPAGHVIELQR